MPIFELIAISVGALAVWLWIDSVGAREIALRATSIACASDGLQLLDETVAIRSLRPTRDADGRLRLLREYGFEFSDTGNDRRTGRIILIGQDVEMLQLQPNLYVMAQPVRREDG